MLFRIFTKCWNRRWLPDDFRDTNIIPLYNNKGNRRDCNNYRGISLLCIAGKVFACLLLPRLRQISDIILPESQCGFRPFRSTSDMVFSPRQLQEKSVEQSRPLYVVFIDLTKAFDTVSLYNIFKLLGCLKRWWSMSKTFPICRDVKQVCVLAPTLFGIFFSALLAHAFPEQEGIMLHTRSTGRLLNLSRLRAKTKTKRVLIRELLYADDAAIVAHSEVHLQNLCERFAKACNDFSMTINLTITVVMSLGNIHSRQAFSSAVQCLMLLRSSLVWDLLPTLRTIWTTESTNELERLRLTPGNLVLGFGKITTSQSNYRSGSNYRPLASWLFCYTAARRGAHAAAKKTSSMHFISNAFAPFLVSRGGIMSPTPPSCISPVHTTSLLS